MNSLYLDNRNNSSPEYNKFLEKKLFTSLTCSQIWLIFLVNYCKSTYLTKLKKNLGGSHDLYFYFPF
jgi:hypothetical protein